MHRTALDKKVASLHALRSAGDRAAAHEPLRRALNDRNNYIVGRAAAIIGELRLEELIPDLLVAFDRFFEEPVKADPQCLAKNAIAQALKDLGHHAAAAYVRGIVHVQLEPTWGGRADSAAALRGTCALALTDCYLDDLEILTYLADALGDPDKLVRIDSAIAIHQLGRPEGALLLRLKLLMGDQHPDVLGQCFSALLGLATDGSLAFVSRFLQSANADVQLEAASALAHCRDPQAIEVLKEFWHEPLLSIELRRVLLIDLGASPLSESADFLLAVVAGDAPALAATALTALSSSRYTTPSCETE